MAKKQSRFIETGEFRPPNKGEFYKAYSGGILEATGDWDALDGNRYIVAPRVNLGVRQPARPKTLQAIREDRLGRVLDAALTAAEKELAELLKDTDASKVAMLFSEHINTHLAEELRGAARYGNSVAAFRKAVNDGEESAI